MAQSVQEWPIPAWPAPVGRWIFHPILLPARPTNRPIRQRFTHLSPGGGSAITGANPASGSGNAAFAADLNDAALLRTRVPLSCWGLSATIWVNLNCAIPPGETVCPRLWILNQTVTGGGVFGADTACAFVLARLFGFQQNNRRFLVRYGQPHAAGDTSFGYFPNQYVDVFCGGL